LNLRPSGYEAGDSHARDMACMIDLSVVHGRRHAGWRAAGACRRRPAPRRVTIDDTTCLLLIIAGGNSLFMEIVTIGFIRARRAKIDFEIERQQQTIAACETAIADLMAKKDELDIAERVISEILVEEGILKKEPEATVAPADPENGVTNGAKPEGIPSIPDMITEAIRNAHARGDKGMEPIMMTAFIRARWWPGVSPEKVNPIAWRMWKRGQLSKNGSAYALPRPNKARTNGAGRTEVT
jgi:hypothetical protein